MEPAPNPIPQPVKSSYGSLFSIFMIVAILVMGAFYVWNKRVEQKYQYATPTDQATVEVNIPTE